MTATLPEIQSVPDLTRSSGVAARRKFVDRFMTGVLALATLLALIPLVMIIVVTINKGREFFTWEFLSQPEVFSFRDPSGGFYNGLVGTLLMVALAALFAIPLGILAAVFLVEFKTSPLVKPVRFFTDVMTGVPSVFVGLFVFAFVVGDLGVGQSALAGAIALAIIMLPIIVRTSEEIIRLVPAELRNAAYGLGARRHQVILKVVLPAAVSGLTTACMLAVARACGETAPLLLTAFGLRETTYHVTGTPIAALPLQILDGSRSQFPVSQGKAWAGALELILLVLVLTAVARLVGRRAAAAGRTY